MLQYTLPLARKKGQTRAKVRFFDAFRCPGIVCDVAEKLVESTERLCEKRGCRQKFERASIVVYLDEDIHSVVIHLFGKEKNKRS
ncbi:MAG: hypothetical protein E7601_08375 [Ruminococcaceae bacterium]|nr:hypothetical protein [Oscillospiraceae bacterium]